MSKFIIGQILMTRGVNDLVSEDEGFARFTYESLKRHRQGDWGDLAKEDKKENEFSLDKNLRLLSATKEEVIKSG